MSQATFDDDELFGEAANEMRADVEASLAEARAALPGPDAVWDVESENTLGVLNALKGSLDTEDAEEHLRDAKKWFTMGRRADAFDDADDLEEAILELEELFEQIETAHEQVSDLASTIPQLRGELEDAAGGEDTAEAGDDADADDEEAEAAEAE